MGAKFALVFAEICQIYFIWDVGKHLALQHLMYHSSGNFLAAAVVE